MIGLQHYLFASSALLCLGVLGLLGMRKNIIHVLMCVELILLAVNMNFVAFSHFLNDINGQVFVFFILTVAAAEAAIGLAIILLWYRQRNNILVDEISELKG